MLPPVHSIHGLALCAVAVLVFCGTPAGAQEAAPTPRFAFVPVEGGALKLDTETGRVSRCTMGSTGFACIAVPDSRDAYEAEIARLQSEIAELRRDAGAPPATSPGIAADGGSTLDQAFDYATRFYRNLRRMIDDFARPNQGESL